MLRKRISKIFRIFAEDRPCPDKLKPASLHLTGMVVASTFLNGISMKILHTADWHLGNTFHGHERTEEHRHFMAWLLDILRQEEPDALVVAGDLYDNANPSAAAQTLLFDFLEAATAEHPGMQLVLLAGNHDSASRLEAPAALLRRHGIFALGTVPRDEKGNPDYASLCLRLTSRTDDTSIHCLAIPFLRPADCPPAETAGEGTRLFLADALKTLQRKTADAPLLLAAHFYATGADVVNDEHSERLVVGGQECVDVSQLSTGPAYVALGHIHKAQRVAGSDTIRYAGSVLPMSFSEKNYRHGVVKVIISPDGKAEWETLSYEPLRRLQAIPETGACNTAEAFEAIRNLPNAGKKDNGHSWPYLEIKIRDERPEPSLVQQIMTELGNKAVHFCRLVRVRPAGEATDDAPVQSLETLKQMTPLDMAQLVFKNRYDTPMPDDLATLFEQAREAAEKNDLEERNA